MRRRLLRAALVGWTSIPATLATPAATAAQPARFEVTVSPSLHAGPLTGRLVVVVSKNAPWAELVRRMGAHVTKNAPAGDDTRAWKY